MILFIDNRMCVEERRTVEVAATAAVPPKTNKQTVNRTKCFESEKREKIAKVKLMIECYGFDSHFRLAF